MSDRYHIAIHEAGHAVIGRAMTMVCGGATIVPNDDLEADGNAVVADADAAIRQWEMREKFRDHTSAVRGRIITVQSGHEAEAEILGVATSNDEDDCECAEAMIEDAGFPDGSDALALTRLRRFARQLVRQHRADIERVAAALLEREALTGEEIDAMLPPGFMARPVSWALALAEA